MFSTITFQFNQLGGPLDHLSTARTTVRETKREKEKERNVTVSTRDASHEIDVSPHGRDAEGDPGRAGLVAYQRKPRLGDSKASPSRKRETGALKLRPRGRTRRRGRFMEIHRSRIKRASLEEKVFPLSSPLLFIRSHPRRVKNTSETRVDASARSLISY